MLGKAYPWVACGSRRATKIAGFGPFPGWHEGCIARSRSDLQERFMDAASSVALSGQLVRERQMDVLANNIANLSTTAYKGEQMLFAEFLATSPDGARTDYVRDNGTVRDWSEGPLTQTGDPLDVALQGGGFLEVQTAAGIRYTRDGRLKLNPQGQLSTIDGDPVLGDGAAPIQVPQGTGEITIGTDGTMSSAQGTIGKLAVVSFAPADLQGLVADGQGLYETDATATPDTETLVRQDMLEGSNVQPVLEMTRLMNAARAAGVAKNFQDNESDRHKNAIDRLAKTV
jgi:flagellar basal-body rod protein FlgF